MFQIYTIVKALLGYQDIFHIHQFVQKGKPNKKLA